MTRHAFHKPHIKATGIWLAIAALGVVYADDKTEPKPDIEVTVSETQAEAVDRIGKASFDNKDLNRQLKSAIDLNQIAKSLPGVQYDNQEGQLNGDSILDLRPSRLSISGGRVYDNNFQIEGLSTNSVQNTTNENMHDAIEVVVHPQTSFLNPALVDSVTVYTSDIPAEFGSFTGGVVSAKLRDPAERFSFGSSYSYTSDNWVRYLFDPADNTGVLPNKPQFERQSGDFYVDLPLSRSVSLLIAYARNTSTLENTQRQSLFGVYSTRATTNSENYTAKLAWKLNSESTLRFTSLYTPYRQENYEQSPKFQDNNGWLNKVEFTRKTSDSTLELFGAYSWSSTDRDQEPYFYTYKNIGSINWVASTAASASKGGSGDILSRQTDLPVGAKFEKNVTATGKLALGADYQFTRARRARPTSSSAYRHQTSSTVKLDPRVTSADGPNDLTVIEGEQALNYRIYYSAFDAQADLNAGDVWAQWSDKGKVLGLPWSYRAGLRADRDNFLSNTDVAPRFTAQVEPLKWLKLNAGYNRYYTRSLLAYALREKYPASLIYTRTGKLSNGKLVFSQADWVLYSESKSTGYGSSSLDTPYSDEFSYGATLSLGPVGTLDVAYLVRQARKEFSRDAGTKTVYTKADGTTSTTNVFRMTNGGYTDYKATTLTWTKNLKNHRFQANATFSDTKTSTTDSDSNPDFFDTYEDTVMQESVYYNGAIVTRRSIALDRGNFARPTYVNLIWGADWFRKRLKTDLIGRWNTSYNGVELNGSTTVNGAKYDRYDDVHVPANLIADLNISWVLWQDSRHGSVELTTKIGNVLNRLPYSEGATITDPYQLGRSFLSSVKYSF
jgi:hypothetical protein